jgi:hypothetical protein
LQRQQPLPWVGRRAAYRCGAGGNRQCHEACAAHCLSPAIHQPDITHTSVLLSRKRRAVCASCRNGARSEAFCSCSDDWPVACMLKLNCDKGREPETTMSDVVPQAML